MNYLVIIFRSRSDALSMRSYLAARGVSSAVINAPRSITHSCGLALKITSVTPSTLSSLLKSSPTKVQYGVFYAQYEQGGIRYRQLFGG
ncbi:MAG: DUF3343 domain-containing protein [Clostridia bacterium]|nr:DUF3343 domain-containing protein [Clostridia bacterium]MDE7328787.1 DUF3343 domain-containing protein [Clostridia bacterium]